jgi:hypothetical protein
MEEEWELRGGEGGKCRCFPRDNQNMRMENLPETIGDRVGDTDSSCWESAPVGPRRLILSPAPHPTTRSRIATLARTGYQKFGLCLKAYRKGESPVIATGHDEVSSSYSAQMPESSRAESVDLDKSGLK